MKILSIDTSSEACSASLNIDGALITRFELAPQKHSSLILPMCDALLAENETTLQQLDAIAFGAGPGSFTGLRIAAGVVQGIAFGADLPVIKVSTLAALSMRIPKLIADEETDYDDVKIIASIDARMQEMYWCIYGIDDKGLVVQLMQEAINNPADVSFETLISSGDSCFGIGTGWDEFSEQLNTKKYAPTSTNIFAKHLTSAEEIGVLAANKLQLGEVVSAEDAIPVYLRNDVAKKSQKQNK